VHPAGEAEWPKPPRTEQACHREREASGSWGWGVVLWCAFLGPAAVFAQPKPFIENKITEQPAEAVTLVFEAEDFDGLKVYADFHRKAGQGWYVKEHRHASARAFVVCDAQSRGAAMTKTFDRSYPAGTYLIGLKAVCTSWRSGVSPAAGTPSGNIARVELGLLRDGTFEPAGGLTLQTFAGSGYGFVPLVTERTEHYSQSEYGTDQWRFTWKGEDPVLTARTPWNAVRIVATKVVSGGMGDVPEFSLPYLVLDQVKITNVPGYQWRSGRRGRFGLLLASELAARERAQADRPARPGAPAAPAPKAPPVPTGNRVADGSFEAGGRPWWTPALVDDSSFTFDPQDLVRGVCPHGERFARLIPRQNGIHADQDPAPPQRSAHIRSKLFDLPKGSFVLSFFARGTEGAALGVRVGPYRAGVLPRGPGAQEVKLTAEWTRYTIAFDNPRSGRMGVYFSTAGTDPKQHVDLDAVQLVAKGADTSKYVEADGAALRLACGAPYGVYHDDEPLRFEAVLCNTTEQKQPRAAVWRVTDITDRTFATGTASVAGGAGVHRTSFDIDFAGYGNFLLEYRPKGEDGPAVLVPFSRVQNPARVEKNTQRRPYLGARGTHIRACSGRMLRRYGFGFKIDLNDPILRADRTCRGYREHDTYRNEVEQVLASGLRWSVGAMPFQPAPYDPGTFASGPAPNGERKCMSTPHGVWYFRHLLATYKDYHDDILVPGSEFEEFKVARDGPAWFRPLYRAVKATDPNVRVVHSIAFTQAEVLTKLMGGAKGVWVDWLAGSRYGVDKWHDAREQRLLEELDLPYWVTSVTYSGNACDTRIYRNEDRKLRRGAVSYELLNYMTWDLALLTATLRPERFTSYVTKYGRGAVDIFNQISPFDGRLTPNDAQWVVILQFLRKARRGGLLIPKHTSNIEACHFRIGEMNWVALWARSPSLLKEIELKMPADELTVLDYRLLKRKATAAGQGARIGIQRGEVLFVGSRNDGLNDAVVNMTTRNLLEIRHAVLASEGGVECVSVFRNNSGARHAGRLTLYENMLHQRGEEAFAFDLGPGEQAVLRKQQAPDAFAGRAITFYPVYAKLAVDDMVLPPPLRRSCAHFWTHNARPVAAEGTKLDLAWLATWQTNQTPASVYVNWGLNGSVQREQVRTGAQNTDPDMQPDGYMPHDFLSMHYVRYDREALYLGAVIEDAPAFAGPAEADRWGEAVIYTLQPDLARQLGRRSPDDLRRVRVVQTGPDTLVATLRTPDGTTVKLEGLCAASGNGRRYLIRVPFSKLGFAVQRGQTLGFAITCRDSDTPDGKTEAEYDWSGATYAPGDAFGFGQLLVRD